MHVPWTRETGDLRQRAHLPLEEHFEQDTEPPEDLEKTERDGHLALLKTKEFQEFMSEEEWSSGSARWWKW